MVQQENNKRITAIVPAYNEAPRIEAVLEVLTTYPNFKEIIVIDDGSTDNTKKIIEKFNIVYAKNPVNKGKGYSMDLGVSLAQSDILFFCDADVSGLTHDIIDEIIQPVLAENVDMFIGMRNRKWYIAHQIITFIPLLGGERAVTKELWQKLPKYYKHYFRIEAALNFFALYYGNGFQYKIFKGLSQVIKEKKYGLLEGARQRLTMMLNVISAQLKLHLVSIPESTKNKRKLAIISLHSMAGIILGAMFFLAMYFGPTNFIYALFAEDLAEESSTPVIDFLLRIADVTTVSTLMFIGFLILIPNAIIFLFTFKNLGVLLYGMVYKIKNNKSK